MAAKRLRFRKRSDKDLVFIPDVGRILPGQILEGPEYKRFCPALLEEIEDVPEDEPKEVAKAPQKPSEPPPATEPSGQVTADETPTEAPAEPATVASGEDPKSAADEGSEDAGETAPSTSAKMRKRAAARRKRRTT